LSRTILLVDDEPDILESVKSLLERSIPGVRVLTATSGPKGLEVLARDELDLIISDFRMPGMDGIEFLQQCRRRKPAVARVMLTAFGSEELARRAVTEAFVHAFLSKGAEPDQLVQGIKGLLDQVAPQDPAPEA
jgi:CheY-like chemotaxis protein